MISLGCEFPSESFEQNAQAQDGLLKRLRCAAPLAPRYKDDPAVVPI